MKQESGSHRYQEQRRQAIRSAAAVFAEKGFHGSSTRDIAEHLGIKQGSLYYYFKSKEEALGEVCLFGIEDYVHRMQEIAASDQAFEAKLTATVTSHLSCYRERNEALKVYNDERLYLPAGRRIKLKQLGSQYRQQLEGIFEQGMESGVLRPSVDCHFAAQAVIGLCNAWGDIIVRDPDINMFDIIQKCTDLLLNGFAERRKVRRT
ncbi:MAG: TetR/AcrR family transcriptional regulator [Gammaproteobacteria bacterium]|nr:TetR/AcrR family transcriptional regulator [Gammaproteobacteria bacterium]MDH4316469.1 TetR/AcrR family transcriptional regulator [Gammaproteobacteria bacterium]MDH5215832.1 TetR/AcrR family transcriptional regulator [Gammaproteobacteria bacterium]